MPLTHSRWRQLAPRIVEKQPDPEGWQHCGLAAVQPPTTWLATGFCATSPRTSARFQAYAFAVPLYLPAERLHTAHSVAIRGPRGLGFAIPRTGADVEDVADDLIEAMSSPEVDTFLSVTPSPAGFADTLGDRDMHPAGLGEDGAERFGYSMILAGRPDVAERFLRHAQGIEHRGMRWRHSIACRATTMLSLLADDVEAAVAQLDTWAQATADAVGIVRVPTTGDERDRSATRSTTPASSTGHSCKSAGPLLQARRAITASSPSPRWP
jgi:hypothetical protein